MIISDNFLIQVCIFLFFVLLVLCLVGIVGLVFMLTWNLVFPYMFGFAEISFIRSVAVLVMLGIIGSFFKKA